MALNYGSFGGVAPPQPSADESTMSLSASMVNPCTNEAVWPKTCSDLKFRFGKDDEPVRAMYDAETRVVSIVDWATSSSSVFTFCMDDVVGAEILADGRLAVYK